MHTVLPTVVKIRINVAIVNGRQRVTTFENVFDYPTSGGNSAALFRGAIVDRLTFGAAAHPGMRQANRSIVMDGMVATKI